MEDWSTPEERRRGVQERVHASLRFFDRLVLVVLVLALAALVLLVAWGRGWY